MKHRALAFGLLLVTAASCLPSPTAIAPPTPTPSPTPPPKTLRALAQERGFYIGSAMSYTRFGRGNVRQYTLSLVREFNMLTVEQEMKFGQIHPEPDRYDFGAADWCVGLGETYDMAVRGHTLVWHQVLPAWLLDGNWTREEAMDILREHIHTVVGHYRGWLTAWDVVNEAVVGAEGALRDTFWLQVIGPEYLELAFRWAHEADPDVLLFYNDWGGEGLGGKSDAIYDLVKDLKERGVPIHGVGFEMHIHVDNYPDPQEVASNMQRYAALGLQVHITEMDVAIDVPVTQEEIERQAVIFRQMLDVCLSAPNCMAFVLWGFSDRQSWVPFFFPERDEATIMDKAFRPKPAYNAVKEVLGREP